MLHRKSRRAEDFEDAEYVIDLNAVNKEMTVAELEDIAKRNKAYLKFKKESGLTDEAWLEALCISKNRENVYCHLRDKVPNSILNRAHNIYKRIHKTINLIKRSYDER